MTNTVTDTKKTNTIGSKLEAFFKDNSPKTQMILNGLIALCWTFCTVLNLRSLIVYNQVNRVCLYLDVSLALFYIGLTFGYAIKYSMSCMKNYRHA